MRSALSKLEQNRLSLRGREGFHAAVELGCRSSAGFPRALRAAFSGSHVNANPASHKPALPALPRLPAEARFIARRPARRVQTAVPAAAIAPACQAGSVLPAGTNTNAIRREMQPPPADMAENRRRGTRVLQSITAKTPRHRSQIPGLMRPQSGAPRSTGTTVMELTNRRLPEITREDQHQTGPILPTLTTSKSPGLPKTRPAAAINIM